ncbi:hypothetical protein [Nevskia ramosa]|uniref:hypothetical protein n=1 Tax=Nevskia ramosa TaxID=64002 RepID=UPI003D11D882
MTNDLSHKLSNIISGHRINQDDADWLRGLLSRQITPAAAIDPHKFVIQIQTAIENLRRIASGVEYAVDHDVSDHTIRMNIKHAQRRAKVVLPELDAAFGYLHDLAFRASSQAAQGEPMLVGDSNFEDFYQGFSFGTKGKKQLMREAYEAGLNERAGMQAAQGEAVACGWLYDTYHHETGRDDIYTDMDPTGKPGAANIRRVYTAPPAPAVPQGWREFIAECAKTAGKMVNGNQFSERANGLLAGTPEAAGK